MEKNEDYIFRKIIWKGNKYELPSNHGFFFEDLPQDKKDFLLGQINVNTTGKPAILFTTQTDRFTLICTRQVLSHKSQKISTIELNDIEKIIANPLDNARNGKEEDVTNQKSEWSELVVYDRLGNKHMLDADKGADLFALWNILLMVIRLIKNSNRQYTSEIVTSPII